MKKNAKTVTMSMVIVCFLISIIAACSTQKERVKLPVDYQKYLTTINPDFMISSTEAFDWHKFKDQHGPTYSGNESWQKFLAFTQKKLQAFGVIDISQNKWSYDRWYTSDWPDDSNWSLQSDGRPIAVAHYGAYSGSTGPEGLTAELVLFNPKAPLTAMAGKIVVIPTAPHPKPPLKDDYKKWFTLNDYEYMSDPETFAPLFTQVSVNRSVAFDVWWQLRQTIKINALLAKGKAAGAIVVFNMGYDRLAGLYTFPILKKLNTPTLYLDRDAGARVIADAKQRKAAVLRLIAKVEPSETYQLIGYLPGKNYGTPQDEKILLITQTDGPSISQDNGAFGLLGIIAYFSHFPRAARPRTLMVFLDNQHYMPGMERGNAKHDWFTKHPEDKKSIVALIAMEHLGQMEFREVGGAYAPTGNIEPSLLWTRNNQMLIDKAIKAVKDNKWPRVMVQSVERPGIHGGPQGVWYGMGKIALTWDLPAYATMGIQGAYWSTTGRLDEFDKNQFVTQVEAMSQLTGELMLAEF
ncbi:MAG: hypothetical protein HKO68_11230 [Desulfobacterales bacterium]|nr:hypothetical protein [Desulfobacterales bacterium]